MTVRTASVVGSGPNGLAAALTLAMAGIQVTVYESSPTLGGGSKTSPFGPSGYFRDDCSAVHPMVLPSPFFKAIDISSTVPYAIPEISYAHALEPGRSAFAYRDIERTADHLGGDGQAWSQLLKPLAKQIDRVANFALRPLLRLPQAPLTMAQFGLRAMEQSGPWGALRFRGEEAPALLAGVLAHGSTRLPSFAAAAAGLVLAATAHADGWPIPLGGAQVLTDDLVRRIKELGGRFHPGHTIRSLNEITTDVVIADVSARNFLEISGNRGNPAYVRALGRQHYGQGIAKIDLALDGPVPWADSALAKAPTIHLGGRRRDVFNAENAAMEGRVPSEPFVLAVQPSVLDARRAASGGSTLWAYMHAPRNSAEDYSGVLMSRLESFAPGLNQSVIGATYASPQQTESSNKNYIGGDIASGQLTLRQLLARPVLAPNPWRTGIPGVYLASAATVPGPGVHGMAGFGAALAALRDAGRAIPKEFIE